MAQFESKNMIRLSYFGKHAVIFGKLERLVDLPMMTPEIRAALLTKNPKAVKNPLQVSFFEEDYAEVKMQPPYNSMGVIRGVFNDQLVQAGFTPAGYSEDRKFGVASERWVTP